MAPGRAAEAADRFRAAAELDPNYSQAQAALGRIDVARGRAADAAEHARRAAGRAYDRPGNLEASAEVLANYGGALLAQGDAAGARTCFESALAITPNA